MVKVAVLNHSLEANVMRIGKHAVIGLLVILLLGSLATTDPDAVPFLDPDASSVNSPPQQTVRNINPELERVGEKTFTISQETQDGILDPVEVKETGYLVSDTLRARTDTGTNVKTNVRIDEGNGWFASQAGVEVENLRRLYALNGTFEDGTSPWVGSTYDPSGGKQAQSTTMWKDVFPRITRASTITIRPLEYVTRILQIPRFCGVRP
ncbi:MAG: hypothetical protein ACE5H4_06095 [Candidatus Thorarchaeota archaeon]